MEQEIIAERQKGMIASGIATLFISAIFIAVVFVFFKRMEEYGWIMVAVMLVLVAILVVFTVRTLVRASRVPKVIAVREDDSLLFLGERIRFSEITKMDYRNASGRYGMQSWGKLTIFLRDGRTLSCDYVARVNRVYDRIMQIKYENGAAPE